MSPKSRGRKGKSKKKTVPRKANPRPEGDDLGPLILDFGARPGAFDAWDFGRGSSLLMSLDQMVTTAGDNVAFQRL